MSETISVNPEIAKILRKQTDSERSKLEALILRDGIQDPVVVWKETGEILDGHNRVDIASGNNSDGEVLDYAVEEISLPHLEAAIEYVLERQEGKRNATPQDLSNARGKLYRRNKKKQGAPTGNSNASKQSGQNDHFESEDKTAERVGKDSGVSEKTARRDAEYSIAVESLTRVFGRDFEAHVLSGESKLSKADTIMLSGELGKDDDLLFSAAELWAFGKTGTFKLAYLLARCHRECGPKTHEALWEHSDDNARVRESAPQLIHLLKLADTGNSDEVTEDLVKLAESGHANGVIKAHERRQKERQRAEQPEGEKLEKAAAKWEQGLSETHKHLFAIRHLGGIATFTRSWSRPNKEAMLDQVVRFVELWQEQEKELREELGK